MKPFYSIVIACILGCGAVAAQGSPETPEVLTEGTKTVAINEYGFRQVFYYSYTSPDEDRLLSMTLPTSQATVVVSYTGGNPYQSEFPTYCVGNDDSATTSFACYAPKGRTIYLKVTLLVLAFPAGTTSAEITVDSSPCVANNGQDINNPIKTLDGKTVFIPFEVDTEAPFLPLASYTSYEVEHDGWLYLNFTPSITSIYYRLEDEGNDEFTYLKGEYVIENGKTVGTKAFLKVDKGDRLLFELKGFNGAMLTTTLENPDPGTSCDFPLLIEDPGMIAIPNEPGDWYWIYTPAKEGYIELTSDTAIPDGHIEVMMDCNHTGSFTIYDDLHLRTWVYDRMEYLIYLKKENTTEGAQFNLALTDPLPCDDYSTAQDIESGQEYETPDFAGTYYYRIAPSPNKLRDMKLSADNTGFDERTRVNLFNEEDRYETLARGFDMAYTLEPETSYILMFTLFDTQKTLPFTIKLEDKVSGIDNPTLSSAFSIKGNTLYLNSSEDVVLLTDIYGRTLFNSKVDSPTTILLDKGLYLIKTLDSCEKIIIP